MNELTEDSGAISKAFLPPVCRCNTLLFGVRRQKESDAFWEDSWRRRFPLCKILDLGYSGTQNGA